MKTNIKIAREQARMQQKECADAIGVTLRAWQGYEQGIREPKFETLCNIANLFGVSTDYLLGRDSNAPEPIDQLEKQFNMSALEKKIVDNYLSLPKELRTDLMDFLKKSVNEIMEEETAD